MVILNLKDLDVDHVAFYNWDQDQHKVYIQLYVNSNVNVKTDVKIDVNDLEITVKYKDEIAWCCQFYAKVVEETCTVQFKDNKMVISIDKKKASEDWHQLQNTHVDVKQDSDEESSDSLFELVFLKNDFYERESTVTVSLFVKQILEESVKVKFEPHNLDVKFSTRDCNFLKSHEGTSEETIFHWKITLSNPVLPKKCTYKVKSTQLEIKLNKETDVKWTSLEKPLLKSTTKDAGQKDSWHSLGSTPSKINRGAAGGAKSITAVDDVQPKKPTCAVQPMSYLNKDEDHNAPHYKIGFTGLDNMGNTCFMNSVLQVLANTRELREYVLSGLPMQNDLNPENPLGSSGKLMVAFAVLIKNLWSGNHKSVAPKKLKALVAGKASQFMGYAQHDAQEFMAFLLDILHEDVNRVKKKPYFENVEGTNLPEQVLADEAWKRHKARNDSVIVDLFHGQYKSKLVCPVCNKVSETYDPFMELVVPLPKKKQIFSVIFMSRNYQKKPVRYTVSLPEDALVQDLKQTIADKTGLDPTCLRVFRENEGSIHYRFRDVDTLSKYRADYFFYVVEVLSKATAGEKVVEISVIQRLLMPPIRNYCSSCKKKFEDSRKLKRCMKCYKVSYCDQSCQRQHWSLHKNSCAPTAEPVGVPFIISLPESKATYRRLEEMMEGFARYSVDVFQPPVQPVASAGITTQKEEEVAPANHPDRPIDGKDYTKECDETEMEVDSSTPTLTENATNQKAGSNTATVTGQIKSETRSSPLFHIKPVDRQGKSLPKTPRLEDKGHEPLKLQDFEHLAMDWRNNEKMDQYVMVKSKDLEYDEDDCDVSKDSVTTLEHCIDLFTRPERLSKEEAWYCPTCKEHREATKEMSIWRLPSTLIIQLKRFSFKNALWRDKITKKVIYPVRGLDLTDYVHGVHHSGPTVYDLYGVINHHGGLLGGHYMALARLPAVEHCNKNEIDWRQFDDSIVRAVDEKSVVIQSAYLLFYRQRKPYQSLIQNPMIEVESAPLTRKEGSLDFVTARNDSENASTNNSLGGTNISRDSISMCRDSDDMNIDEMRDEEEEKNTDMEIVD
ncbi:ubiquitin carboxyl-terminal hydrolase 19-like [Anneissia japonica]|uniref:ubiquitin carboxyl-terminal hydrolase 19-like n=1 Tax=Anneissia japonica TaxID=1529436 RepID=UPI00142552B8|nr:ubiquitin carboxyl-terminal hydrolase 19-like [Anneissia japonica]XP_033126174.1 ubiquitin carboxyl-terminal hydrolase 19-like [Anneissia japonica]